MILKSHLLWACNEEVNCVTWVLYMGRLPFLINISYRNDFVGLIGFTLRGMREPVNTEAGIYVNGCKYSDSPTPVFCTSLRVSLQCPYGSMMQLVFLSLDCLCARRRLRSYILLDAVGLTKPWAQTQRQQWDIDGPVCCCNPGEGNKFVFNAVFLIKADLLRLHRGGLQKWQFHSIPLPFVFRDLSQD